MNKTAVFSFTLLIILVSQISLSSASYTSTKTIAAFGSIKEKVGGIFLVAYGLDSPVSNDVIELMARFDLLDIDFRTVPDVERIKALNPNIKIVCYNNLLFGDSKWDDWLEVNAHEDWFIHSLDGRRIVKPAYPYEQCMNVTNLGWRQHYANYCLNKLAQYPALAGIFADNVWDGWTKEGWSDVNGNPIPPEQVPDLPTFHDDMLEFLRYVKNAIGDKLLIPNTRDLTQNYVNETDGMMWEGFAHAPWHSEYFYEEDFLLQQINLLSDISQRGKFFLALSGTAIPDSPTQEDLQTAHDIMLYCYACFLLGVNGPNASFGWNNIYSKDGSCGYYPEFDVSLGSPVNEYYSVGSVYARDFAGGKVLVNPTTSIYTVNLDGEYKTLDGQRVSNVTLDAHSGIILLGP